MISTQRNVALTGSTYYNEVTDIATLKSTIKRFLNSMDYDNYLCIHSNPDFIFDKILSKYNVIKAAGGIVSNDNNDILMIHRRGKWDLPKGKVDEGETIENASVREVIEETGLKNIVRGEFLCKTFHFFSQNKENIIKETHWYAMQHSGTEKPTPQAEEEITEVAWCNQSSLKSNFNNSYRNIIDLIDSYTPKLT